MISSTDQDSPGRRRRHLMVVLERHPESVRVILDSAEVRLAAYFPLSSLQPTPASPVKLIQPGVHSDNDTGVTVFPAINGHFRRRLDGFWDFTHNSRGIHFTGRLPASRVTWVFNQNDLVAEVLEVSHLVKNGTVIRYEPGGAEVARVQEPGWSDWVHGVVVQKRKGSHVLVILEHREFWVHGWVRQTDLKKLDESFEVGGAGHGMGGWGTSRLRMVEAGTRLYACPSGPQVGIVLKRTGFGDEGPSGKAVRSLYRYDPELGFWYTVCIEDKDSSN
jgi:hypothetical protein